MFFTKRLTVCVSEDRAEILLDRCPPNLQQLYQVDQFRCTRRVFENVGIKMYFSPKLKNWFDCLYIETTLDNFIKRFLMNFGSEIATYNMV